jgi:hypothetical protein
MFVTAADFNLIPYSIPNVEANNSFQDYVDSAEKMVLESLLGISLYDAFVEGLNTDYPEERWIDLRDGANYEIGVTLKKYRWVGMKKMLTPYIYQEWLSDTWDNHTGIGIVKGKGENAKVINPGRRIASAYHMFSTIAGKHCERRNTLYGFLTQMGISGTFDDTFDDSFSSFEEYLNFSFKDPGSKNTFQL